MELNIATCQFPTSSNMENNYRHIGTLMQKGKELSADVAHFPEACLSGYAGTDIQSYAGFDWGQDNLI